MYEHVDKRAKMQRSKERQTGGTKQTRQAYQHRMEQRKVYIRHTNTIVVYLTRGYISLSHEEDGCNHTSTRPKMAQSMEKPRSKEDNMDIRHRSKQANIDMQWK